MRVTRDGLIVHRDIYGAIAGLTASIEVRTHLHVEHQVPYEYGLTPLVDGAERDILHILHQTLRQVTTVIPSADAGF